MKTKMMLAVLVGLVALVVSTVDLKAIDVYKTSGSVLLYNADGSAANNGKAAKVDSYVAIDAAGNAWSVVYGKADKVKYSAAAGKITLEGVPAYIDMFRGSDTYILKQGTSTGFLTTYETLQAGDKLLSGLGQMYSGKVAKSGRLESLTGSYSWFDSVLGNGVGIMSKRTLKYDKKMTGIVANAKTVAAAAALVQDALILKGYTSAGN